MKILVTGAAGFLGRRLVTTLLSQPEGLPRISRIVAADLVACPIDDPRLDCRIGTIADPAFIGSIVDPDVEMTYHLAAVLSGEAEADLDLGLRINVDATRSLLEASRRMTQPPRLIFSSTIAVFGGALPDEVPEDMAVLPQSSYGAEKAIAEILVHEYSRRGFIDAVVCRLPTVAVRPGTPNSAVSSFVSGIIREPLAGIDSVCPVPLDTRLWVSSPDTTITNLVHAARVPVSAMESGRSLNLPGLCVTPSALLESLERLGGSSARARVRCEPDARVMRIVCSWPGAFEISRPLRLGFTADENVDAIVRQFMIDVGRLGEPSLPR